MENLYHDKSTLESRRVFTKVLLGDDGGRNNPLRKGPFFFWGGGVALEVVPLNSHDC